MWDVFILEALSDSVKNVLNLVQLVTMVDIFLGVNEVQGSMNLEKSIPAHNSTKLR